MNMKRIGLLIGVSIFAGAVGYLAGLFALLTATGLADAEWVPVAALAGIGLASGIAVGLVAQISTSTSIALATTAAGLGALIGLAVKQTVDSFEWALAAGFLLAIVVAVTARAIATSDPTVTS